MKAVPAADSNGPSSQAPWLSPFGVAWERMVRHRLGLMSNEVASDYLKARGVDEGTSPASISAHKLGKTPPHPNKLNKMLDAFEATEEERALVREAFWETNWR
jgi:hypothetical protein